MKVDKSSRVLATLEQGRILMDNNYYKIIKELWSRPTSAGELVERLGLSMNVVHYRLRRLVENGLAEIDSLESRSGRPIKRYRMTSEEYIVPFNFSPNATVGEFFREQISGQHEEFMRSFIHHMDSESNKGAQSPHFRIRKYGNALIMETDFPSDVDFCISAWQTARLTRESAKLLETEVMEAIKKYSANPSDESVEKYIIGFQSSPIVQDLDD